MLAAANRRYAPSRSEPGAANVVRLAAEDAGIVERTGADSALAATRGSRIVWSSRSIRTGTATASSRPTATATPMGISGDGSSGVIWTGFCRSTMVAYDWGTIDSIARSA